MGPVRTNKEVISAIGRAIKQIDTIKSPEISGMDQFYIDTARDLLLKIVLSNGYEISDTYRIKKIKRK
jgi:hypothetical protein